MPTMIWSHAKWTSWSVIAMASNRQPEDWRVAVHWSTQTANQRTNLMKVSQDHTAWQPHTWRYTNAEHLIFNPNQSKCPVPFLQPLPNSSAAPTVFPWAWHVHYVAQPSNLSVSTRWLRKIFTTLVSCNSCSFCGIFLPTFFTTPFCNDSSTTHWPNNYRSKFSQPFPATFSP